MNTDLLSTWRTEKTPGRKAFIDLVISGKALDSLFWLVQKCTSALVQNCTLFDDISRYFKKTLVQKCTTNIPGKKH